MPRPWLFSRAGSDILDPFLAHSVVLAFPLPPLAKCAKNGTRSFVLGHKGQNHDKGGPAPNLRLTIETVSLCHPERSIRARQRGNAQSKDPCTVAPPSFLPAFSLCSLPGTLQALSTKFLLGNASLLTQGILALCFAKACPERSREDGSSEILLCEGK